MRLLRDTAQMVGKEHGQVREEKKGAVGVRRTQKHARDRRAATWETKRAGRLRKGGKLGGQIKA